MKTNTALNSSTLSATPKASDTLSDKLIRMLRNTNTPAQGLNDGSEYLEHTVSKHDIKGESIQDTIKVTEDILTISSSTLENSLNNDIELPAQGYEYTHSDTISTTNRTGWVFNYGFQANVNFNLLFASGGVTHTLGIEYSMSTDEKHEETITRKWKIDSFNVKIPAGKKYKIDYIFTKVSVSGNSKLEAELFGSINYKTVKPPVQFYSLDLGSATEVLEPSKREGFETLYAPASQYGRGVKQVGVSPFSAVKGIDFFIHIYDVTDRKEVFVSRYDQKSVN
ncbi:hypothetical protein Z042_03835 [Chania multitudinisentens RB-25]|uniref:Uncharacterized protein n=1 Tax=Chania multitudinisentens RB-25 TaxID=1441930 RepID=W0LFY6_9GAMM|nr:ETX/MTX2 family pore-forming toxin [Chania multitudinisentens]AHG22641.1 hypothetical protein Z042_03835 [Chania multitudinisentens RB-25]